MKMKFSSLLFVGIFGISLFQSGCGNADNQNLNIASSSPTPPPTANSSPNQNTANNGASERVGREMLELNERCKHAPVDKAKAVPITGNAPLKVTFDGSSSYDPDGTKIVKWEWHFGDGQSGEGKKVSHIYEKPGKYSIGFIITDLQGQKNSDCGTGATKIEITVGDSKITN